MDTDLASSLYWLNRFYAIFSCKGQQGIDNNYGRGYPAGINNKRSRSALSSSTFTRNTRTQEDNSLMGAIKSLRMFIVLPFGFFQGLGRIEKHVVNNLW